MRRGIAALVTALSLPALCGCAGAPAGQASPAPMALPRPTAVAIALGAARVLVPYHDPLHTFEMGRPQTWVALDARSSPRFAQALGDGVRFFEPVTAADPDAGSSGKLWVDVLPVHPGSTPRQVLLAPFAAADYPASLLRRMRLVPYRLGGAPGYRLVTLASHTQVTLLLVRRGGFYYRLTIFGAIIPPEVERALHTWRFVATPP